MTTNGKIAANGIDDVDFRPSVSIISDKVEVPMVKLGEFRINKPISNAKLEFLIIKSRLVLWLRLH